jgi:two-component system, cell cycle sensor histidine kinase and response regulator CckA
MEDLSLAASSIAHKFNNLLMAVQGNHDLALMDLPQGSEVRSFVEEASKAALRASELSALMLTYARRHQPAPQLVDLTALVDGLSRQIAALVPPNVRLKQDLAAEMPRVLCDPNQVGCVVMNLVTNAVEAIGELGGNITITTSVVRCDQTYLKQMDHHEGQPDGTYICLQVSDTGCGIAEPTSGRIFEPFFTTKSPGRGLGLTAALGVVRRYKGAVLVRSELGRGTTISALLPPASETGSEEEPVTSRQDEDWGSEGTVLLADDEDTVRYVAKGILERMGFSVLTAADGAGAVELFREQSEEIRCVILDMNMPGMSGAETLDELRAIREDVRVIAASGFTPELVLAELAGRRVDGFIEKPYQATILGETLRRLLG